jgi:hypothetical protein
MIPVQTQAEAQLQDALAAVNAELFNTIVGLPVAAALGQGVTCPVTGDLVGFSTAVHRADVTTVPEGVKALAGIIKAEAERVGAVRLHVLTPCTVLPLASVTLEHFKCPIRVDVFWDGLFELADGSLHSPKPCNGGGSAASAAKGWILDTEAAPSPGTAQ